LPRAAQWLRSWRTRIWLRFRDTSLRTALGGGGTVDARTPGMSKRLIIIGGGLSGLSAGCYAQACGFRTTIVEHNLALGGVCQSWTRGAYTIDGCIHWLTGGPFDRLYRELGVFPRVSTHTLSTWIGYQNARSGFSIALDRDADGFERALLAAAPEDAEEIARVMRGIRHLPDISPPIEQPAELITLRQGLGKLWEMRGDLPDFLHFRKPVGEWARASLRSPTLQRLFAQLMPEGTPTMFLLFTLGYLARGWLSRPDGGSGVFRDALVEAYRERGGEALLHATVDEILVEAGRVVGVRLADGSILEGDAVISTASTPETTLRLLGGRYGADELRRRLAHWKLFEPIVLCSFGVSAPLDQIKPTLLLDELAPFELGGRSDDKLYLRIFNDDPTLAPAGHSVVQAMIPTTYEWWAKQGSAYSDAKDQAAERIRERIQEYLPAMRGHVEVTDIATPLTYWRMARSWRGAYEGWMPSSESFGGHVRKTLPGLHGLYLAGQWVEPGGGVPLALLSGRQVIQLLCSESQTTFVAPVRAG
jgi:phytoene desaturase